MRRELKAGIVDDKHSEKYGEGVKVPGNDEGKSALTLFSN